jgi:hypothetical protein
MGEALIFTIRKCGGDAYTPAAHQGWVKVYSRILGTIIPVVVRFEIESKHLSQ